MKVLVDEKTYRVSWIHGNDGVRFTVCEIHGEDGKLVVAADASCSPSDQFVKETGRKLSLARALHKLFPSGNDLAKLPPTPDALRVMLEQDTRMNQLKRAIFWAVYFNRKEGR